MYLANPFLFTSVVYFVQYHLVMQDHETALYMDFLRYFVGISIQFVGVSEVMRVSYDYG